MNEYLFVLGRTPELAFAELQTLFPSAVMLAPHAVLVSTDAVEGLNKTPEELIDMLGGTIKIAGVKMHEATLAPDVVAKLLLAEMSGPLVFGVGKTEGEDPVPQKFLARVKELLQTQGKSVRFVSSEHGALLSSIVVSKQHVTEIIAVPSGDGVILAKTLAVQNADSWSERDYGRPYADPKAGMLPPKVARMVVNIAMIKGGTLLDPFCGMGTILAEGLLSGATVIGSDQSQETVEKARKNIEWLGVRASQWKLLTCDATHVSEHLEPTSVDAIVTEPFMGSTRLGGNNPISQSDQLKTIKNTIKGLEKLYLGCLKDWHMVLKPEGRIVMAIPGFHIGDKMLYVKNVIDRCEILGYTKLLGPIEYSRPQAVVRRQFFVFQKS